MGRAPRHRFDYWGLGEVLETYPGLAIRPRDDRALILAGELRFRAKFEAHEAIADVYKIGMRVPDEFPRKAPTVRERGGRIPSDYHTNLDGTLCLGSSIGVRLALHDQPTLPGFIKNCLLPFLYARSYYERHGRMPFGALAHGGEGLFHDYMNRFRVNTPEACLGMLTLLSMKRQIANKEPCPCGSGRRVGQCHNRILNPLRSQLGRRWCRREYAALASKVSQRSWEEERGRRMR